MVCAVKEGDGWTMLGLPSNTPKARGYPCPGPKHVNHDLKNNYGYRVVWLSLELRSYNGNQLSAILSSRKRKWWKTYMPNDLFMWLEAKKYPILLMAVGMIDVCLFVCLFSVFVKQKKSALHLMLKWICIPSFVCEIAAMHYFTFL